MTNIATLAAQVQQLQAQVADIVSNRTVCVGTDVPASPYSSSGTGFANLSASYTIPANDPQPGTVYRITCSGDFNDGASPQVVTWSIGAYGTREFLDCSLGSAPLATFGANKVLQWTLRGHLYYRSVGVSGVVVAFIDGSVQGFGSNAGNADDWSLCQAVTATGVDTTTATAITIQGAFGGSTSGQVLHGHGSVCERFGPLRWDAGNVITGGNEGT